MSSGGPNQPVASTRAVAVVGVTGAVPLTQLFLPSVRCRVNDSARGVSPPPCVLHPGVRYVGVWTVVSMRVLGVLPRPPFGEGGNTNSICDASGVAIAIAVAGAG